MCWMVRAVRIISQIPGIFKGSLHMGKAYIRRGCANHPFCDMRKHWTPPSVLARGAASAKKLVLFVYANPSPIRLETPLNHPIQWIWPFESHQESTQGPLFGWASEEPLEPNRLKPTGKRRGSGRHLFLMLDRQFDRVGGLLELLEHLATRLLVVHQSIHHGKQRYSVAGNELLTVTRLLWLQIPCDTK